MANGLRVAGGVWYGLAVEYVNDHAQGARLAKIAMTVKHDNLVGGMIIVLIENLYHSQKKWVTNR